MRRWITRESLRNWRSQAIETRTHFVSSPPLCPFLRRSPQFSSQDHRHESSCVKIVALGLGLGCCLPGWIHGLEQHWGSLISFPSSPHSLGFPCFELRLGHLLTCDVPLSRRSSLLSFSSSCSSRKKIMSRNVSVLSFSSLESCSFLFSYVCSWWSPIWRHVSIVRKIRLYSLFPLSFFSHLKCLSVSLQIWILPRSLRTLRWARLPWFIMKTWVPSRVIFSFSSLLIRKRISELREEFWMKKTTVALRSLSQKERALSCTRWS